MRYLFQVSVGLMLLAVGLYGGEPFTPGTREAFAHALKERVAVVGVGDSNQRFGGHGWSAYMARALESRFGCWGTGLAWMVSTKEDVAGSGPAPEAFATSFAGWYLPAGKTEKVSWRHGQMHVSADSPLDVSGNLLFHLRYGTFTDGEGVFQPSIRLDKPPWSILASHEPVRTAAEEMAFSEVSVELPADPARQSQLMFSASPVSRAIEGPFYGAVMQGENLDKASGIAYSTLYAAGGQSLVDMLNTFTHSYGPGRCVDYFKQIRQLLNGDKRCIVMISSGLNDRNELELSLGPLGQLPSATPEGFRDNLAGIVNTLEAAWIQAGGRRETIFFAFMPSHPVNDPDDAMLTAYRAQAVALAGELPNADCILWPELVTYKEMAEMGYYDKGEASSPHLSREGYQALAAAAVKALAE